MGAVPTTLPWPAEDWPAGKARRRTRSAKVESAGFDFALLAEAIVIALVFATIGIAHSEWSMEDARPSRVPQTTIEWRLASPVIAFDRFDYPSASAVEWARERSAATRR